MFPSAPLPPREEREAPYSAVEQLARPMPAQIPPPASLPLGDETEATCVAPGRSSCSSAQPRYAQPKVGLAADDIWGWGRRVEVRTHPCRARPKLELSRIVAALLDQSSHTNVCSVQELNPAVVGPSSGRSTTRRPHTPARVDLDDLRGHHHGELSGLHLRAWAALELDSLDWRGCRSSPANRAPCGHGRALRATSRSSLPPAPCLPEVELLRARLEFVVARAAPGRSSPKTQSVGARSSLVPPPDGARGSPAPLPATAR
jgi:hypothetical protein